MHLFQVHPTFIKDFCRCDYSDEDRDIFQSAPLTPKYFGAMAMVRLEPGWQGLHLPSPMHEGQHSETMLPLILAGDRPKWEMPKNRGRIDLPGCFLAEGLLLSERGSDQSEALISRHQDCNRGLSASSLPAVSASDLCQSAYPLVLRT